MGFSFNDQTKDLVKFIEDYLEDELAHHYVSFDRSQKTAVKWINAETFEKMVVQDTSFDQCVIEIIKDYCPACMFAKFDTNLFSRKMQKHGYLQKLPVFRMKIDNQIPWLGDFPHSPLHLYLKKEGD
jgi:hypothetical protein